jgi:hypothetical protein
MCLTTCSYTRVDVTLVGQGVPVFFATADADGLFDGQYEDNAVTLFAIITGSGGVLDGFNRRVDVVVAEDDVDLDVGQHFDDVGAGAPFQFDPCTAPAPAHLHHVEANDTDFRQRIFDCAEFILIDNRFNFRVFGRNL